MPIVKLRISEKEYTLEAAFGSPLKELLVPYMQFPCAGEGICGGCKVRASGELSPAGVQERRVLGTSADEGMRLACLVKVMGDCEITAQRNDFSVLTDANIRNNQKLRRSSGIAVAIDIGTTTVVTYFLDFSTGRLLHVMADENPQRCHGADVITRINFSSVGSGREILQKEISGLINSHIKQSGFKEQIKYVSVAANTVMLHFFSGLDASPIAVSPYIPQNLFGAEVTASSIGLEVDCPVLLLPCTAGYVGSDITAGIYSSRLMTHRSALFLDLGTNGEIALYSNGSLYCCAAAAGPAFEGGRISCGMPSVAGAVNRVWAENNMLSFETIGGLPPRGICGSGLIDLVAILRELDIIDETGKMEENYKLCDNVTLSPLDVREIQLAKAAVAAGISVLLQSAKVKPEELEVCIMAGGFGSYADAENLARIGMIPHQLVSRAAAAGNAAGSGACSAALSQDAQNEILEISKKCNYIELSGNGTFSDAFIELMPFDPF